MILNIESLNTVDPYRFPRVIVSRRSQQLYYSLYKHLSVVLKLHQEPDFLAN